MKKIFVKGAIWLFIPVAVAAAAVTAQTLPDGDGKKIVEERCSTCHGLDLITSLKKNKDEWKSLVDRMVGYGATLNNKEQETTVDYLAKSFGAASGAAPAAAASDDAAVKKLTEEVCSSCHDFDLVKSTNATKDGWKDLVNRMNNRGAGLNEKDSDAVVNYLAKTYPAK